MLIYLHGFRSSPRSAKASLLAERMRTLGRAADFVCPQLPPSPFAALELLKKLAPQPRDTLVGSSLGGFYATWLAEKTGARCVLLNPAVDPADGLQRYVGVQKMFHSDEPFEFKDEHVAELRALTVGAITFPARYFLIAAKGDELLDWRDMVAHYPGARHKVLEGSDHGLADFADYLDEVLEFAGVLPGQGTAA
ncbi:MAG: YqiA/YcfP family alpha/beta fold hydrolase [Burkholderiaceae bacterium]